MSEGQAGSADETQAPAAERRGTARSPRTRWSGLLSGLALFAVLRLLPAPQGMEATAWAVAALAGLMAVWWITEAVPVAATALLPVVALPLLGVRGAVDATAPYAHPLIFLFLGGFLIALAIERWGLHRRLALALLRRIGTRPDGLIAGFLIVPAALSMWLSNTATSLVMLPIGLSVAALLHGEGKQNASAAPHTGDDFDAPLLLAIAYGASIGGMATLIGTPPNALLAAFLSESYGRDIGFAQWMAFGLPVSVLMLAAAWLVLTRLAFRVPHGPLPGAQELVAREAAALGATTGPEKRVAAVFATVALLWLLRPQLDPWLPAGASLGDPGIAVLGALALFALPSGRAPGERLLHWSATARLPWGVLVLFGGGLSLAGAIAESGLAAWIAGEMLVLADWPLAGLVATVSGTVVLLTEFTSNTATAATFLPLLAELAAALGHDPLLLAAPAAVAASCAFMLPVATPPNAIVYGSGYISIPQMARAGIWLNVLSTILASGAALVLVPLVFG